MNAAHGPAANPLLKLQNYGQSVWLDYLRRSFITSGEMKRLIDADGLRGITSNPSIFEKAIGESSDYDESLERLLRDDPDLTPEALYELLALEDIRTAADAFRPVFEKTQGADGLVSFEVSPVLAHDTERTVAEARRLWKLLDRPNVMIKVPATREGFPAIEQLIADGVNVNITLMFSSEHYENVTRAFLLGLEACRRPARINSVASFFVSRVDSVVDKVLERVGTAEALELRGKTAIANSQRVYARFRELFYGESFAKWKAKGVRVQRPLWASTSTKNPAYSDVLYVESLIGPDTVNTMPPATLNAFRDHGRISGTTAENRKAEQVLEKVERLGIDLNEVAEGLLEDGVAAFAKSYEQLLSALEKKRAAIVSKGRSDGEGWTVGPYEQQIRDRLSQWQQDGVASRIWQKDPTVWSSNPNTPELADRLGWLSLPELMHSRLDEIESFAQEVKKDGFLNVVLLGMGGSSLAPAVLQDTFGNAKGYPELIVLDSTHPGAVKAVDGHIDFLNTLFVVSSKSGTTTEPLSLFYHYWSKVDQFGQDTGRNFVAITDPGTPLVDLARRRHFRKVFLAQPDVGGRYSALSHFGLVPGALIGLDIRNLVGRAWQMAEACAPSVPAAENPGLKLGAALAHLAAAGRDKVTFITGPEIHAFPLWLEQLIAESTGKGDKGLVPVAGETVGNPDVYGKDRFFVRLSSTSGFTEEVQRRVSALVAAGHPIADLDLRQLQDLGREFFRWEFAVASAGAILQINPFDQPDVQLAKDLARKAMNSPHKAAEAGADLVSADREDAVKKGLEQWLAEAQEGDYIGLQAYLAPSSTTTRLLELLRNSLRDGTRLATTVGYGPRFLHSTGQLHKGGPNTGLFLQLLDEVPDEVPVPETEYSFGALIRAQAEGDYEALKQRGRRILRVNLGRDAAAGLERIVRALGE